MADAEFTQKAPGARRGFSWKKTLQWVLMSALALALLYFAFRGVKWEEFVRELRECDFGWILVSMAASILAFLVRGLRWRLAMLPLSPAISRREAYDGVTIGYLTNFALPRAGEFARCGVISATGKASFEAVLGSVVLERSWDLITYVLILLLVLLIGRNAFSSFVSEEVWQPAVSSLSGSSFGLLWIVALALLIIVLGLFLIYRYRARLRRYKVFAKFMDICKGLLSGLAAGLKMKHKWAFFGYTILLWGCYALMSYSTIRAFPMGAGMGWGDALFLMVVGSLGWLVPVQGGIGAYHLILSKALTAIYGIPQTSGVIFATISHESQALTMLVCGAISLLTIYIARRRRSR